MPGNVLEPQQHLTGTVAHCLLLTRSIAADAELGLADKLSAAGEKSATGGLKVDDDGAMLPRCEPRQPLLTPSPAPLYGSYSLLPNTDQLHAYQLSSCVDLGAQDVLKLMQLW